MSIATDRPKICTCGLGLYPCPDCLGGSMTAEHTRMRRTEEEIAGVACICLACEYFRVHARVGGRCIHRQCQCLPREQEVVPLHGVSFNGGLVELIRWGACPDGRW